MLRSFVENLSFIDELMASDKNIKPHVQMKVPCHRGNTQTLFYVALQLKTTKWL